jgi:hypothetical protein
MILYSHQWGETWKRECWHQPETIQIPKITGETGSNINKTLGAIDRYIEDLTKIVQYNPNWTNDVDCWIISYEIKL